MKKPLRTFRNRAGAAMAAATCALALGAATVRAQNCTDGAATPSVCAFNAAKNAAAKTHIKGVLLYDWTHGGHSKTHTQDHLLRLSQKYGFRLDRSESATYITAATLEGIDLIVFNNGDQDPLQNAASLAAVKDFVEAKGKAIMVIHAGAAYIECPEENLANASCRWIMRGLRTQFWIHNGDPTKATIFADSVMAGQIPPRATGSSAVASTRNHGRKNPETRMIFEGLPGNAGGGGLANAPFVWEGLGDEWYNYQNNPRLEGERVLNGVTYGPINILLSLDESSVAANASCSDGSNCKNKGTFGDRPVSWTRKMGKGLFAYQNAGHSNVYTRVRTVGGTNVNDSIIEKYNWRLMRYLARDFIGCMDANATNYNPEASVTVLTPGFDNASPCGTVSLRLEKGKIDPGIVRGAKGIIIPMAAKGIYKVLITDIKGEVRLSRSAQGGAGKSLTALENAKGTFFVKVEAPETGVSVTRVQAD
jgi:hypothetical protein